MWFSWLQLHHHVVSLSFWNVCHNWSTVKSLSFYFLGNSLRSNTNIQIKKTCNFPFHLVPQQAAAAKKNVSNFYTIRSTNHSTKRNVWANSTDCTNVTDTNRTATTLFFALATFFLSFPTFRVFLQQIRLVCLFVYFPAFDFGFLIQFSGK